MRCKIVDEKESTYRKGWQQIDSDITCKSQIFNLCIFLCNAFKVGFMYCWRRTVCWSQQLSRGSFDPRREPQENLKAKKRILGFRNWFLLLDMVLIWNLSRVWLGLGARPAFRYRRFCALDNYTPADLHEYVDTVFRKRT